MTSLAHATWRLADDVALVAVASLPEAARARLPASADCVVIARRGTRAPAQLVDRPLAELLCELATPSRIADAVLRYARARRLDAERVLEESLAPLAALVRAEVLVREDAADTTLVPTLPLGAEVSGLRVERLLRLLADSELYLARARDGMRVALKLARREGGAAVAEQLAREAEILQALALPQVPALVARGEVSGSPFLATRWHEGAPLLVEAARLRAREGACSQALVTQLAHPMALAFAALHERGVIHGDVHGGNVLVCAEEGVTVLDFGLARWLSSKRWREAPRSGALAYLEPAAIRASAAGVPLPAATVASDTYALAVLVYEVLTGAHPWALPATRAGALLALTSMPPRRFVQLGLAPAPALEEALRAALGWPEGGNGRPATAAALAEALRRWTEARAIAPHVREPDNSRARQAATAEAAAQLEACWRAGGPRGVPLTQRTAGTYRAAVLLDDPLWLSRAALGARALAKREAEGGALDALVTRGLVARALADAGELAQVLRAVAQRASACGADATTREELAWGAALLACESSATSSDALVELRRALVPVVESALDELAAADGAPTSGAARPLWAFVRLAHALAADAPALAARATAMLEAAARAFEASGALLGELSAEAGWAIAYEASGVRRFLACAERAAAWADERGAASDAAELAGRALARSQLARVTGSPAHVAAAGALAACALKRAHTDDDEQARWRAALAALEVSSGERGTIPFYASERWP